MKFLLFTLISFSFMSCKTSDVLTPQEYAKWFRSPQNLSKDTIVRNDYSFLMCYIPKEAELTRLYLSGRMSAEELKKENKEQSDYMQYELTVEYDKHSTDRSAIRDYSPFTLKENLKMIVNNKDTVDCLRMTEEAGHDFAGRKKFTAEFPPATSNKVELLYLDKLFTGDTLLFSFENRAKNLPRLTTKIKKDHK